MGTQQLLLIVLGVIIVGIAVVVGINIFGQNAEQAAKDAAIQDCLRIAATAQGYYRKPEMLGGGGNDFTDITMANCGMTPDAPGGLVATNENAQYTVAATSATVFTVTGQNRQDASKEIVITVDMGAAEADRVDIDDSAWE
jgi:hypothetical protein